MSALPVVFTTILGVVVAVVVVVFNQIVSEVITGGLLLKYHTRCGDDQDEVED